MIQRAILSSLASVCVATVATIGLTFSAAVFAHDEPAHYDRINLSASADRDIQSDTSVAVMYKQHQSSDQTSATEEVNQAISWAVEQAKAEKVTVTTSSYRTQPVYNKQHIQGWRVLQTIRLESDDGQHLARLLGTLQPRLAIQSLHNTLSIEARKAAEESLIAAALEAFQDRATAIAKTLGRSGHRIVTLNINAGGGQPPRPMMRSAMAMDARAKSSAPTIESGTLRVEVQINGTIELNAH
jgi:predicted secreted protein